MSDNELLALLGADIDKELNAVQCIALIMLAVGIANKMFEIIYGKEEAK